MQTRSIPPLQTVLVRNDTGTTMQRHWILGINGPVISPADDADEFKRQIVLKGVEPVAGTHEGKFVVLAEPLTAGRIGRAYISGVVPVEIVGLQYSPDRVEIVGSDPLYLNGDPNGSAEVIWRDSGSSPKWALVRLGPGFPQYPFVVSLTKDGGTAGGWDGDSYEDCSFTYTVKYGSLNLGAAKTPTHRQLGFKLTQGSKGLWDPATSTLLVAYGETIVPGDC
jgi:hypothetical protein